MNDFSKIKINVAYSEILVYDEYGRILCPNSNVSEYDIHPWYTPDVTQVEELAKPYGITFPYRLSNEDPPRVRDFLGKFDSNRFENLLDNDRRNFVPRELDEICNTNERFIYPIILHNNDLFYNYDTLDLDNRVVECILTNRAKLVFIQATEGFFGENDEDMRWISRVSERYGFSKEGVIIITSNLMCLDNYNLLVSKNEITDNLTIRPYSYFQHSLWFAGNGNLNHREQMSLSERFNIYLEDNKRSKKRFHFLAFNRVVKPHRLSIFAELMSNNKLMGKSIVSMGGATKDPHSHYHSIMSFVDNGYKHDKNRLLDFYKDYDSTKHYVYDEPDLENNKAASFNTSAQRETFLNIVTESLIGDRSIFFSEKTYKPILAAQPFIIFGSPNSLKKLREQGFITFDKWWDESYDQETNFTRRLEKIVDVLEEVSTWSLEKCYQVTNEMESVLRHNFNTMMSTDDTYKLYSLLRTNEDIPIIKKTAEPIVKNVETKKILGVCGTESMGFTTELSKRLNWDLISLARHGCDNAIIRLQIDNMIKIKPDYVIIGFASSDYSPWERQKSTWIITDGLRKLMENNIGFSYINNGEIFENDLYFVKDKIILEPKDFGDQNSMINKWYNHFINNNLIIKPFKRRLI